MTAAVDAVMHIFGVPIVLAWPAVEPAERRQLANRLLDERRYHPGLRQSNVGGWHSVPDLCRRDDPTLAHLFRTILADIETLQTSLARTIGVAEAAWRYGMQAWVMVMEAGDYTVLHDHAEAHWSFVFYLDAGDADPHLHPKSGVIAWTNHTRPPMPVPGLDYASRTFDLTPQTGQLVVFPGWLPHFVHPYRGTTPRIAIAGNVKVEV